MKKNTLILLLPLSTTGAFIIAPGQLKTARDARPSVFSVMAVVLSNNKEDDSDYSSSSSSEPTNNNNSNTANDDDDDNNNSNNKNEKKPPSEEVVMMSKALPFLPCPPVLVDSNLAGNVGFDPLHLAQSKEQLLWFREAEMKHARLAMLAAAGWPISELFDRQLAAWFGFEPLLDSHDRAPSLFDNLKGLERVSPSFWGFLFGLTAVVELEYGLQASSFWPHATKSTNSLDYFPGKLDIDPLGFYPKSKQGQERMQLAEIKHGRIAMLAVVIYCLTEYVTKEGIVDEVPFFFFPIVAPAETTLEPLVERFGME